MSVFPKATDAVPYEGCTEASKLNGVESSTCRSGQGGLIMSSSVDVLIIGGGPAGLATALSLCRARHTAVVFDSGTYRNDLYSHMHAFPTWDHADPKKYREAAHAELVGRYRTVQLVDLAVKSVLRTEGGDFVALDAQGREWTGRKLVLATGVKDIFPEIPGYSECWVKGIFHCLICHGYEETGVTSAGILAVDDLAAAPPLTQSLARNALQFTTDVTIYTNGSEIVATSIAPMVQKKGIKVDTRKIARLIKESEGARVTVEFEDGTTVTHGFLVHKPKTKLELGFAEGLGLELAPSGAEIKVIPPFNETTVKGCFAVGDAGTPAKVVVAGVAFGTFAAAGLIMQLQAD